MGKWADRAKRIGVTAVIVLMAAAFIALAVIGGIIKAKQAWFFWNL
jgi:hypothetical protein